jgi:hypothetical protein
MLRKRMVKEGAEAAREMSDERNLRKMFSAAMQEIRSDWSGYEI